MDNEDIVQKIIAHAEKVVAYCERLTDQRDFQANPMLLEACVFNLSQIGELAHKLDDTFTGRHAGIPWRALYGLRNRIIHDYEGVNNTLVFDIIRHDLPVLIDKLKTLMY